MSSPTTSSSSSPASSSPSSSSPSNTKPKTTKTTTIRHIVGVCVKMALFRIIFGFVKQLVLKGRIFQGTKKISSSLEGELVSFNPLRWAAFGGTMALYRPLQLLIESLLRSLGGRVSTLPLGLFSSSSSSSNQEEKDSEKREGEGEKQQTSTPTSPSSSSSSSVVTKQKPVDFALCLSSLLSGALVSLPVLKIFNITTRTELCLYVSVRAAHAIGSGLLMPIMPGIIQAIPAEFFNGAAMGAASFALLGCGVFQPEMHSKEYGNFLVHATTFDKATMQCVDDGCAMSLSPQTADVIAQRGLTDIFDKIRIDPVSGRKILPQTSVCRLHHPKFRYCTVSFFEYALRHMLKVSLPLYGPLKIITTAARGPGYIAKAPVKNISKLVTSILSSSLFLTLYVCGCFRAVCFFNQIGIKKRTILATLCGIICGTALQLEPVERQTDLVLFCAMHAARCSVSFANKMAKIGRPNRNTVALFHTCAWSVLFLIYEVRKETLRGIFGSLLNMFIGDNNNKSSSERSSSNNNNNNSDKKKN